MNYTDEDYALYPKSGGGILAKTKSGFCIEKKEWIERRVIVETTYGFVIAKSNSYQSFKTTSLKMIKDGRAYWRVFKQAYSIKHMVTLGKQFANELFNDES